MDDQRAPTAPPLSAAESDPATLGWMRGSPPPVDKRIAFADGSSQRFPQIRWSFANLRQIVPSVNIAQGGGTPAALPTALNDAIDDLRFTPLDSRSSMTWAESLEANYTDAICVLHRGRVVYERYFGVMTPTQSHVAMSVTKSYVGLLAAMMVHDGVLDPGCPVETLIPELGLGAFRGATVRDVMDMRVGVRFSEDYADPSSEVRSYSAAARLLPRGPAYQGPEGLYAFLQTLQQEGPHGEGFHYKTATTDVLGWLLHRVSGRSVPALLAERLWHKLGAESDAYMLVDGVGTAFAGGGLNLALRDMARLGEMLRCDGHFNGQQIVPAAVVADLRQGGSTWAFQSGGFERLQGYSYRSQWWISHNAHGAFMARGIHGQAIYIDPLAEMVIARFGSHPMAANRHFDATSLPAFHALACHLTRNWPVAETK